ncbi:MAG: TonB-dependent receptor plug domain-containing protein [Opitutae bacterium]|nr:TonB-dependent receptor plug domain-containing protein [Opitutae bacterium]
MTALDNEIVTLDPFTVTSEQEGYQADDTLGGARIRTKLIDTPSSTSVITPKFLQDLGITKSEDLLRYTTSTETGGFYGNFSGMTSRGQGISGAAEGERLANPAGINRARGLAALDNTRNYLLSSIPWDGYNISRVDISRGPNSFLFGVGSPSGILNVTTNDANFKNRASVEARYGSFGSTRESIDINRIIIPNQLALRFDAVTDHSKYRQDPAYNNTERVYGALRYDPEFLKFPSARTKIQANFESGKVRSNNPRTLPPMDNITGYLKDPRASATGYNPWLYSPSSNSAGGSTDLNQSYWVAYGSLANQYQWGNGPQYYWDAASGALVNAGQTGFDSPRGNGYGEAVNRYHIHTTGYSTYASNANAVYLAQHGNVDGGEFAGANAGSVRYFDQTLSDRYIFDFYNKLIDGPNKREWQDWNALNLNVVQSLFNNQLTLQAVYAHEDYKRGQEGILNPNLILDLDQYLLDYPTWITGGTPNPNLGRPLVYGAYGDGRRQRTERDNYQLTAAYDLDFTDKVKSSRLASILGRHQLTGLLSRSTATDSNLSYKMYAIDHNYASTWAKAAKLKDNTLNWLAYLGPSMIGSHPALSNLSNLTTTITPSGTMMRVYDRTWTAGNSVDPSAPWTHFGPDGSTVTGTQADNPANYRGYTTVPATVLSSDSAMDDLRTSSNMRDQRIDSKAIMYQAHLFEDTVIPSFGYREDKTRQRGTTALEDSTTGYFKEITEIDDPEGVSAKTRSTSYGVAIHMPKMIKKHLPEGTNVSLYYFHGSNETPKVRYGVDGLQLPNERGETDDYSVQVDYKDRVTVRLTRFVTTNYGSQASYGTPLGSNGWFLGAAPTWSLTMAASAMQAFTYTDAQLPQGIKDNSWIYNWARDPARATLMTQIGEAFKNDFTAMFPQEFWDRYGSNVDVAAIKRGDWLHVLNDTTVVLPWTIKGFGASVHGVEEIIDQDVRSKGYELEVTARPVKNWDVTFNVSKVDATQIALGDSVTKHLEGMKKLYIDSAFGKVAMWGGYTDQGAWKQSFMQNLWAPYNIQKALTGADQPEIRKWRFNAVTNYTFDHGFAKGLNVGGSFRWEDKPTLGYGIHLADLGEGQKLWIADVNQPLYGKADQHFDFWAGYGHKLTKAVDWRIQVNVRNVGENRKLVPITLQANGDVAQSRIQEGQTFEVSTKFTF